MFGESSSENDSSDEEDQCKGPKEYHKKSKKQQKHEEHNHEKCNCWLTNIKISFQGYLALHKKWRWISCPNGMFYYNPKRQCHELLK